jgi:hypothetical protein
MVCSRRFPVRAVKRKALSRPLKPSIRAAGLAAILRSCSPKRCARLGSGRASTPAIFPIRTKAFCLRRDSARPTHGWRFMYPVPGPNSKRRVTVGKFACADRYLRCLRRSCRGGFCFWGSRAPGSSAAPSRNQRFLRKQVVQSLGLRKEVGVLLSGGKAQDRPQVAAKDDGEFAVLGHEADFIDK